MPAIDKLIARLYRATADVPAAKFRAWALEAVRSELPFDAAIWATGHHSTLKFHTKTCLDVDANILDDLLAWRDINPIGHYFFVDKMQAGANLDLSGLNSRFGQAVTMAELVSDEVFYKSPLYTRCFKPRSIERILSSLHLHERSGTFSLLSLYRFDRDHPFSDAEKALQQQLLFHLLESERHAFYLRLQSLQPQPGECFALTDSEGIYYQVDHGFLDLIQHYNPNAESQQLPKQLLTSDQKINGLTTKCVREGELWVVSARPTHRLDQLTEREWQVVDGVRSGKSFKTIAKELELSASTVSNHLYRIYRKLGINHRNELLQLCAERK
ncbi:helix-turn-helix transcriptional regulator [Simiduia curdlanivorans]|uniref:Response regulator transcription factor n=1 Tax=Simiduia curdlanivorans TaxID=1492769 RepID=A0ABV8V598_9GAMM|nr:helix-turn-helix transcriptional regulator [Simiduia curdlanivorans]MDN3640704.1 helix-turn-helix transcriptional regulator [Simiduia curdlanivorans]